MFSSFYFHWSNSGCGGVSIAYKKRLFIESTPGMRVNIDDFVLSSEDAFKALGKHVIEEATKSTLQITNWSGEIDLVIMKDGARFSSRGGNNQTNVSFPFLFL